MSISFIIKKEIPPPPYPDYSVPWTENFNLPDGSVPDSTYWTASGTNTILDNKYHCIAGSGGITAKFTVSGPFDVQVDVSSIALTSNLNNSIILDISNSTRSYTSFVSAAYNSYQCWRGDVRLNGAWHGEVKVARSVSAGGLRIRRDEFNNIFLYYYNLGSSWALLKSTSGFTSQNVVIILYGSKSGGSAVGDFDNFIINSGTLVP